jgi:hypothetical protein
MVSKKNSELAKKQAQNRYGRFVSPSSQHNTPCVQEVGSSSRGTAHPPSRMQEVGSSSRRDTAPPSREEASLDDSVVEIWEVASPPPTRLEEASSNDSIVEMWEVAPPPLTHLEEASSNNSSLASSGYNDEFPHVKEVSSYELLLDLSCLV